MEMVLRPVIEVLSIAIDLYIYVIIAMAILSWLVAFNVVNTQNNFVRNLGNFLYRITEPVMGPIRRILPNFGGIDVSPIVVILACSSWQGPVRRGDDGAEHLFDHATRLGARPIFGFEEYVGEGHEWLDVVVGLMGIEVALKRGFVRHDGGFSKALGDELELLNEASTNDIVVFPEP